MKYAEYAEAKGLDIELVKTALEATGQRVHTGINVDEALLDKYFADLAGGQTALAPAVPGGSVVAVANANVIGSPGPGKKLYSLDATGPGAGKIKVTAFEAYAHDSSEAISLVLRANPEIGRVQSGINWKVREN